MNDTMSGDYVNAITAERAAYQREYLRGGHGTYKEESIKAAHARTCSRIIAQAYRAGDYPDMWRALSKATRNDMCVSGTITNTIISHFISIAGWSEQLIDAAAFDCEAFARAVHDDAASTQTPGIPAGVWLLLDHLTGNANRGNSVAGLNAAAIGEHAAKELTASGNLPTLTEHPRRYSDSFSGLAVSAYLAGEHAARDFPHPHASGTRYLPRGHGNKVQRVPCALRCRALAMWQRHQRGEAVATNHYRRGRTRRHEARGSGQVRPHDARKRPPRTRGTHPRRPRRPHRHIPRAKTHAGAHQEGNLLPHHARQRQPSDVRHGTVPHNQRGEAHRLRGLAHDRQLISCRHVTMETGDSKQRER